MKRAGILFTLLFWGSAAWSMPITSAITGADMAGVQVTATFADGSSDTAIWAATGVDSGAASGTGWSLGESGDTFGDVLPSGLLTGVWTLSNNAGQNMTSLFVNAMVANVVFDTILVDTLAELADPTKNTPGSSQGRPFTYSGTPTGITASYGSLVSAPDLYGTMTVDLAAGGGLASGSTLAFMSDTDQVPEPPVYLLFGLGLLGLGLRKKVRG